MCKGKIKTYKHTVKNELLVGNLNTHFMLCSHFSWQIVSHVISNVYLSYFQLLCGQAVVIGFVWMAHLKRCRHSRSREPEPKPIPTLGTAPTRLPPPPNRAAKPVACTSTAPLGRWVANISVLLTWDSVQFDCSVPSGFHFIAKSQFEGKWAHVRGLWFEDIPYGKRQLAFASVSLVILAQLGDVVQDDWKCGS